ncbi:MAG: RNA polymerase sigma factor [Myxococcota bacterium]
MANVLEVKKAPKGSDLALVQQVGAGDRSAQRALTQRIFPRVKTIAYRIASRPADAEDAAQSAMIEILHHVSGYQGAGRLESYCDRIATRATLRHLRGERIPRSSEPDELAAPSAELSGRERTPQGIETYLTALSQPLREALVLRHVLEYSIDEIAELTGSSRNTVKDRLVRARQAMRRQIRRDQNIGTRRGQR